MTLETTLTVRGVEMNAAEEARILHQLDALDVSELVANPRQDGFLMRPPVRPAFEADDPEALTRMYEYYDPIYLLPHAGQEWWRSQRAPE